MEIDAAFALMALSKDHLTRTMNIREEPRRLVQTSS